MKTGFILMEILIGTAISMIVSTLLIGSLYQTNKTQLAVDRFVDVSMQASLLHYQFEHDVIGAFVPIMDLVETATDKEGQPEKEESVKKMSTSLSTEKKALEEVFYGVNKNENLDRLTFITNNPLQIYWGAQVGKPKARIARVTYTLEPDSEVQGLYVLYRQESQNIILNEEGKEDLEKKINKHEIIRNIKDLVVTYEVIQKKDESKKQQVSQKKTEIEYKEFKEWIGDHKEDKLDESSQSMPLLPDFVRVKIRFGAQGLRDSAWFSFVCQIIARPLVEKSKEPGQKKLKNKPDRLKTVQRTHRPHRKAQSQRIRV